jgi:UDP:flavonoid glycosyltransferase YjiC (YdhE family)
MLFAYTGGRGHLEPLVPVARAAAAAGHTIAFAATPSMTATVNAIGFDAFPIGPRGSGKPRKRTPLREVDIEREEREFRERFVREGSRLRAPGVLALCKVWRPDLLVIDETDFGSMVAAETAGLPYASLVVLIATGSFVRPDVVGDELSELRAEYGLSPDPELTMLSRHLVLAPGPPSFRDPRFPLPATAHSFRPTAIEPASGEAGPPPWPMALPAAPTVYFTLGTEFNVESGDLFARVLEGLGALEVNVVATVGEPIDPTEFESLPQHVHVERFIPQATVLSHSSAVVSHAGSGSVLGALAHGLPQVLIPMGADQPFNAARCDALGVARVLDAVEATPKLVRDAVSAVLFGAAYRNAAERLRDEIAALPGPESAVSLLERLADDSGATPDQPIRSS